MSLIVYTGASDQLILTVGLRHLEADIKHGLEQLNLKVEAAGKEVALKVSCGAICWLSKFCVALGSLVNCVALGSLVNLPRTIPVTSDEACGR